MTSEQWTAIAAVSAVVISLVNVGLSAFLVRRQEGQKWVREQLPDMVKLFTDAAHRWEVKTFEVDWAAIPSVDRSDHGMEEAAETFALMGRLEVFAKPTTISAAREVLHAIEDIRFHCLTSLPEGGNAEKPWNLYWAYAEARHAFLTESRREMGLSDPPLPPGLANRRRASARPVWWRRLLPMRAESGVDRRARWVLTGPSRGRRRALNDDQR
ncbi:hypothetical protein [Streptomyces sp. LN245]|uniref:hypothetical protein n=1 Tax=Streptomyces sp. LN245 TaxID=3112975 RepID=UPI003714DAF1